MAALANVLRLTHKLTTVNPLLLTQAVRSFNNKDYKPGKLPQTEKECLSAAKKYNLLPEEYVPYVDDGLGQGDYPHLEAGLGVENKDPYYPYDFPEHKRNFNEVVHADIDLYGEDRYSQAEPPRLKNYQYFASFFGVMAGCFILYYGLERMRMYRPVAAKQYPGDGKVHYTFETD